MPKPFAFSTAVALALGLLLSAATLVSAADPGDAHLVRDIAPGAAGSDPDDLTNLNGTLFFKASGPGGRELYVSDGTSEGTLRINIRAGSKSSTPDYITAFGSRVFFSANGGNGAGRELWSSDGTARGTQMVADIRPGSKGSEPKYLAVMGGKLYFSATGGGKGRELWVTDGSPLGTHTVRDINPGKTDSDPRELVAVGSRLFFHVRAANDQYSRSLWATDGTEAGTAQIPVYAGEDVRQLTKVGSQLFFLSGEAPGGPFEGRISLRVVRPGAQTSVRMTDLPECQDENFNGCHVDCGNEFCYGTNDLTSVGNLLYYVTDTDRLWRSDGTKAGTFKVTNLFGCNLASGVPCAKSFTDVDGTLFFVAPRIAFSDQTQDYELVSTELWKSDGTAVGTEAVKVFAPYQPWYWVAECPNCYIGTFLVGAGAAMDGLYYFQGPDGDLWHSDGSDVGTARACVAQDPCAGWAPARFAAVGQTLFMTADDDDHGRELWQFIP